MAKDFLFGVNLHNRGYDSYPEATLDEQLDDCVAMNQDLIRFNYKPWDDDSFAYMERVIEAVHKRGMKLMLVLDSYDWFKVDDPEKYFDDMFFVIASRLRGKIDIYQLFNEMDVSAMHNDIGNIVNAGSDGKNPEDYDPVRWNASAPAVRGAIRGVRRADPDAKLCVNFAWWHTAMLYHMVEEGCDFDIVGLDWYGDMEAASSIEKITADVLEHLPGKDLMICETNYWMNGSNEILQDEERRNEAQAKWVADFAEKVYTLGVPEFKGIIFYEFHDEPCFELDAKHYHGESHFGLVSCDRFGGNRVFKPAYYSLRDKIAELRAKE